MFAPDPLSHDVWLSVRGSLVDGAAVNVLQGRGGEEAPPLVPTAPGLLYSRWTKYMTNIVYANEGKLLELGRFLCREWNGPGTSPDRRLYTFQIARMARRTPALGRPAPPPERHVIWTHRCFDLPMADGTAVSAL